MKKYIGIGAAAAAFAASALFAYAQAPAPAPQQPMTFFVTSVGKGQGANLGGLAGADAHCQALAAAAGRGGATWRAYLSTQGAGAVNARDRIGAGPWYNAKGQTIGNSAALHMDTLELARAGAPIGKQYALNEKGMLVNGAGDTPNQHDMLTGSTADGRAFPAGADKTCSNWTNGAATGNAQVGHHDRQGGGGSSWNSQHASRACSQPDLVATGGAGLLYCFVPTTP
jgi:hypothetical protein